MVGLERIAENIQHRSQVLSTAVDVSGFAARTALVGVTPQISLGFLNPNWGKRASKLMAVITRHTRSWRTSESHSSICCSSSNFCATRSANRANRRASCASFLRAGRAPDAVAHAGRRANKSSLSSPPVASSTIQGRLELLDQLMHPLFRVVSTSQMTLQGCV